MLNISHRQIHSASVYAPNIAGKPPRLETSAEIQYGSSEIHQLDLWILGVLTSLTQDSSKAIVPQPIRRKFSEVKSGEFWGIDQVSLEL